MSEYHQQMERDFGAPKQVVMRGRLSDIPAMPSLVDLLSGKPFTYCAPTAISKGIRMCHKCRKRFPIGELTQIGSSRDYVFCVECAKPAARIEELERKLAEQQAIVAAALIKEGNDPYFTAAGMEELSALLAKAKEEGRREAVPDGWQVVPIDPTTGMWLSGQDVATFAENGEIMCMSGNQVESIYHAMLAAAPSAWLDK